MLILPILIIMGLICMAMADSRNRNKTLGFIAGFCFGLIAVVYYLIAGTKA